MLNANTDATCPSMTPTAPGWPFTSTGTPESASLEKKMAPEATSRAPRRGASAQLAAVGPGYDIGIEDGQERIEVSGPGRSEERLRHLTPE